MTSIRRLLYLAVGLLLGGVITLSHAATVPYKFNGLNVTRDGGQTYLRGTSPSEVAAAGTSVSNHVMATTGSANWYVGTGALLQNGGVVFNAAVPIAATAAAVAVTAIRANPAGLITSAIASYLLGKGIEYANGSFQISTTENQAAAMAGGQPATPYFNTYGYAGWNQASACQAYATAQFGGAVTSVQANGIDLPRTISCKGTYLGTPNSVFTIGNHTWKCTSGSPSNNWDQNTNPNLCDAYVCPEGQTLDGTQCIVPVTRPTVDSDWDAARVGYWPDPAILDLVKNGVPLPTDKPVFDPLYKDVPLSDPYIDPVTGKRFQDVARVTPQPSAPDSATVQTVKQEVDSAGQPVVDQGTGQPVPPEQETDWCKLNPDASGCKPLDEVPDVELQEDTITLSISPISGFGPDTGTCPSTRTLFSKGGQPVVWEWTQYCDFASGIRPLIIGFAWISALMIVIGVARRNS